MDKRTGQKTLLVEMNNKAQVGPIGFVFLIIVFLIVWMIFLGDWLKDIGQDTIADQSLTGFEAFLWANLNLWTLLALVLGTSAYFYFSGA